MKTRTKIFIAIVSLIILCAWTMKQTNHIKKAEWLIGTWENKTPKGSIYETWSKASDNELTGKSYIVKEQDTIVFENPQHDFPQIISYTKINADSLVAEISGSKNGQELKQTFPMKRVK